jgi:hypothetical protein
MGPSRAPRGRGHGRLQPGRHRRRTQRRTGRPRRLRGLRSRSGRDPRPLPGRTPSTTDRALRGVTRRRRRLHGPGVGPYGRRRNRLLRVLTRGRGGLRGARGSRTAAPGTAIAVGHRVRSRRGRGGDGRAGPGRNRLAAAPGRHRGRRAAVAGGGCHGRRLRVLVHGRAADRRGARHALLRPHPGRRRRYRAARRNGLLRGRPGRRKRPRGCRSRPGIGCVGAAAAPVSGCRRG